MWHDMYRQTACADPSLQVALGAEVTLDGRAVDWERLNVLGAAHALPTSAAPPAESPGQPRHGRDGTVPGEERFVYIKYWKPAGVVSTTDMRVRGNVVAEIGHRERVFPVGRLDKDTTGLLLLTSDGRVPNAVGRSGGRHPKTYWVRTAAALSDAEIGRLAAGVVITTTAQRDRGSKTLTARTRPCEVRRRPGGTPYEIEMSLR